MINIKKYEEINKNGYIYNNEGYIDLNSDNFNKYNQEYHTRIIFFYLKK